MEETPPFAFTVDVEEYFQVAAFASVIARDDWDRWPSRVENGLAVVAALLDEADRRATFFVLGWVAERHGRWIRALAEAGHEIALHGYDHRPVFSMTEAAFRQDLRRARAAVEDAAGVSVTGYRAPSFSIDERTPFAHRVLAEEGFAYSSSVFPGRTDLYGMAGAPRQPYRPLADAPDFWEIPVPTLRLAGRNWPWGGGGYYRLMPDALYEWGVRRLVAAGRPVFFYCHPWECDPGQPRVAAPLKSRVRHYLGLGRMRARLERLLRRHPWGRMDALLAAWRQRAEVAEKKS
ncbi:MAG: DUF3473 domain-containing protein [Alphaproteobacteria bacterium]|nr:MAG: DUF3473 domain-containing protein [Alphaproteobacteria bacterium]